MHRWYWRAVYKDGSEVNQNMTDPVTGGEFSPKSIDTSRLESIVFEPKDSAYSRVLIPVRKGETVTRFWRNYVDANGPQAGKKRTCWVVSVESGGVTFYTFFHVDGTTIISTDPDGSEFQHPCG